MTRETKVGLLIGMGVILLIGIIVSDTLTSATGQDSPDLTGYADRSQDSIFRAGPNDTYAIHDRDAAGREGHRPARSEPIPTPAEVESARRPPAADTHDRQRTVPPAQRPLPAALSVDDTRDRQAPPAGTDGVPTLAFSHEWMLEDEDPAASVDRGTPTDDAPSTARTQADDARTTMGLERTGSEIIHYVQRGETLTEIARKYYGDGQYWRSLAEFNRDVVGPEGQVAAEVRLVIPNRSGLAMLNGDFEPAGTERVVRVDGLRTTGSPNQPRTIEAGSGDTLSGLAAEHLGSSSRWRELLEANADQLSTDTDLRAGMTLKLPTADAGSTGSTAAPVRRESRPAPAGSAYTVRSGDNLTRVAERTLGDGSRWREIYDANRDQLASPDSLKVGQTLRIP